MSNQIVLKGFSAGNFAADITIEPSEDVYAFFAKEGATRFMQNAVLPKWEKNEAIRLGLWPNNEKGVPARPKTYKREMIGFSPEGANELEKLIGLATTPIDGKAVNVGVSDVNIVENSDYSGTISFLEQWLATPNKKDGSARTIEQFAGKIGVPVPNEPWVDETGFLASVKNWLSEQD